MAYRGIGGPASSAPYPAHGEQRGTPSEMDWYYFTGLNIEIKLSSFANLFNGFGGRNRGYSLRCPRAYFDDGLSLFLHIYVFLLILLVYGCYPALNLLLPRYS
ncbi:MAG: hypothetical protein WDO16_07815 [Bacteroidota bacterium]